MAQHIPTTAYKQKVFRTIENGIDYAFNKSRGDLKTSMVFQYLGIQEGNEVYAVNRKIPKGIVSGTEIGNFEVHFNPTTKKIIEIYLVA